MVIKGALGNAWPLSVDVSASSYTHPEHSLLGCCVLYFLSVSMSGDAAEKGQRDENVTRLHCHITAVSSLPLCCSTKKEQEPIVEHATKNYRCTTVGFDNPSIHS